MKKELVTNMFVSYNIYIKGRYNKLLLLYSVLITQYVIANLLIIKIQINQWK